MLDKESYGLELLHLNPPLSVKFSDNKQIMWVPRPYPDYPDCPDGSSRDAPSSPPTQFRCS